MAAAMHMRLRPVLAAALAWMLSACGSAPVAPAAAEQEVAIAFAAQAGDAAVRCGQMIEGLGRTAASAQLRDLRFYASDIALIDTQGRAVPVQLELGEWQDRRVALIDLADAQGSCAHAPTHGQVRGRVPAGQYRGLRFTVGVPHAQNHSDHAVAAPPLDVQGMAWAWQAGRKFLQLELDMVGGVRRAKAGAAPGRSFLLHLGAGGCSGNPVTGETVHCLRPNRMVVQLDGFDPARQRVALDLTALYTGSDLSQDGGGALGCMSAPSDPECQPLFAALGLDLASGQPVAGGGAQRLFRPVPQ